ncbi:hypothetical protein KVR01_009164 [Diaporthe batatas]|uniref:uncharacterized protein n=1 Tax=Diaporthe batatas TaxID=748121 RepID=UPI001D044457|nr:uncharacterized protein KVR01_009164 [Diaporthe batatas]KAG8160900.1 hypothetical protein KVR01_009164 [Diaporthe batatas]
MPAIGPGGHAASASRRLLRTVARPRARPRLSVLVRKSRCMSSEGQARPAKVSSPRPEHVRPGDRELLSLFPNPIATIDQKSYEACQEPVSVMDSKIECLCSWNEARGSRQAIYVPGDASRPRNTIASLSNDAIREALDAAMPERRPWGYCNPGRGPRPVGWDDSLAALCATDPGLKLDHVDVMASLGVLLNLLSVAHNTHQRLYRRPRHGFPDSFHLNMMQVGNTLVLRDRFNTTATKTRFNTTATKIRVPGPSPKGWEYYKIFTEPAPEVGDSSIHHQLLSYKLGPLTCLVRTYVNGSMQDMPIPTDQSSNPQRRDIHGIDVIKAGQGVQTSQAFLACARGFPFQRSNEAVRLQRNAQNLLLSGQTKLAVADVVPEDRLGELRGLTVVEMAELVRNYETDNQHVLRRLVGLLGALRETVRAHGGPCVGIFFPPSEAALSISGERNDTIQVYEAGPDEPPILLDWHKEHFWPQSQVPKKHGFIGKLVRSLGF